MITATEPGLFDDVSTDPSLREKFLAYHRENPNVYLMLCQYALEAIAAGRTRIGIAMLFERLRWYSAVEAKDAEGFKLNNNYRAFYARLWLRDHPAHPEFFATREQRAASVR